MRVDLVAQPQAHVGRDLVVARAAGVQPLAGVADELRQPRLDVEVHVLERRAAIRSAPGSISSRDLRQAALDRRQVGGADDALRGQHLGMREAAGDVGAPRGAGRRRRSPCSAGPARSSARRTAPTRPRISCRIGFAGHGVSRRRSRNARARRTSRARLVDDATIRLQRPCGASARHIRRCDTAVRGSTGAPGADDASRARASLARRAASARPVVRRRRAGVGRAPTPAPARRSTSAMSASCCARCCSCTGVLAIGMVFAARDASPAGCWSSPRGSSVALPGVLLWLIVVLRRSRRRSRALPVPAQWAAAVALGALSTAASGVLLVASGARRRGLGAARPRARRSPAPRSPRRCSTGCACAPRRALPAETTARLAELQSRIRPHFLFNTLNTALDAGARSIRRGRGVLEDLAELFRVAIAESARVGLAWPRRSSWRSATSTSSRSASASACT